MVKSLALVLVPLALGLVSTVSAAPVVAQDHLDVDLAKRSPGLLWDLDLDYGYYDGYYGGWKRDLEGHPDAEGLAKRDSFPVEERDVHPAELDKRQFGGYGGGYGGYGYRSNTGYSSGYYGAVNGGYSRGYSSRGGGGGRLVGGGFYKRDLDQATSDDLAKRSDSLDHLEARAAEPVEAAAEPADAADAEPVDAAAQPAEAYPYYGYRPWRYRPDRPCRYGRCW